MLQQEVEKENCAAGTVVTLFRGFPRKALGRVVQSWVKITEVCMGNSMICSDIWHKYHE